MKNKKRLKFFALSQVSILIIAIFAVAFIIGESERVEGQERTKPTTILPPESAFTVNPTGVKTLADIGLGGTRNDLYKPVVGAAKIREITGIANNVDVSQVKLFEVVDSATKIKLGNVNHVLERDGKFYRVNSPNNLNEITDTSITSPLKDAPTNAESTGFFGGIKSLYSYEGGGFLSFDSLLSAAAWGISVGLGIKIAGSLFGIDPKYTDPVAISLGVGTTVGKLTYVATKEGLLEWAGIGPSAAGTTGFLVGAGVAVALFLFLYKDEETEIVQYSCYVWDAPLGGKDCAKCNEKTLPCSEYQCRALGQACVLENKGTAEEVCVWAHPKDVNPPEIKPWENALLEGYKYTPDNTVSPPDRGVKIINENSQDGCVEAFTPLTFGVDLNEPGRCKLDYVKKAKFEDMRFFFGGNSLLRYNHTQIMSLPGANSNNNSLILQNDGNYQLFVRCQDANGVNNPANFVFSFCVDKGPDTTAPLIVDTNIRNGAPIAFEQKSINVEVYTNEPASCKWSHRDQSYKDMEETMQCSSRVTEMNARLLYKCATTLTGLKDRDKNSFFFRCEDQPLKPVSERNVNTQSYKFDLIGTQPLVLNSVGPNGTISDSTNVVKTVLTAKTSAGFKEGQAVCYYRPSTSDSEDDYIEFFDTNTINGQHKQELFLLSGSYKYSIKCLDLGGNTDVKETSFVVETDTFSPRIVRVFKEENNLKIITSEEAKCVYDSVDCGYDFADGISMKTLDDKEHFTEWNTQKNFYVKCKDRFGNQPAPNSCNIIVRPFDVFKGQ